VGKCTTPDTRNHQLLQLCETVNRREQERCALYITKLSKALIEKVISIPQDVVQVEIKGYMKRVYDEIQLLCDNRKAARSRGENVPNRLTEALPRTLRTFVAKEAKNMLRTTTSALEIAQSTAIDMTLSTALSGNRENAFRKAVSTLLKTYTQAFKSSQKTNNASLADMAKLKALYAGSAAESARLHDLILQGQDTVPPVKRKADGDSFLANKRVRGEGTTAEPIELDD